VFIHPQALCESRQLGSGTQIWAFSHILPNARIGADCNICEGVFIENDVVVGDRVTIKNGVQLWDGAVLEDDVFVGPNATFANDLYPRSKQRPREFLKTLVRRGASIGANATLLPGVEIGAGAMVGAAAVVVRSVPPKAIVVGNPARIVGYSGAEDARPVVSATLPRGATDVEAGSVSRLGVGEASLYRLQLIRDMRGDLAVGEYGPDFPFTPKRHFTVFNVPSREVRGAHAHRNCHQFLVCVQGSCVVLVDDGQNQAEVVLDRPNVGLFLPAMVWGTQWRFSADAVLLVFASEPYDPDDYIRDYAEFRRLVLERAV
jgi:acetyltransferase-like isoleucine patch superfamily enzyme